MNDVPQTTPNTETPQDQLLQGYQQRSFIFGIISLITCVWMAPVGLGLGIAGLVQTQKARKRSLALQDSPPRKFMPQFVLSLIGTIGSAITLIVIASAVIAGLSSLGPIIEGTFKTSSEYPKAVATLNAAKKDFTTEETVEFGPFDLKIRDVQKGYIPTSEEVASPREGVVYTKFTMDVNHSAARGATYDRLSMDVKSWGDALARLELDGARCGTTPPAKELEKYNASYVDGYTDATTITYVCAGSSNAPQELTLDVSLFSKVSPIVGTEGMPRQYVTYSVQL